MSEWFKSVKYSDKIRWINADNVSWVYVWTNEKPRVHMGDWRENLAWISGPGIIPCTYG